MQSYKQLLIEHLEHETKKQGLVHIGITSVASINRALKSVGINHQITCPEMLVDDATREELVCQEIVDMLTAPAIPDLELV